MILEDNAAEPLSLVEQIGAKAIPVVVTHLPQTPEQRIANHRQRKDHSWLFQSMRINMSR